MSKLVVLTLLGGDLNQGFPVVTVQVWDNNQFFKITGSLPAAPELDKLYLHWLLLYEAVHQRLGNKKRIKVHHNDITNVSIHEFNRVCQDLQVRINNWLKSPSFQNTEQRLRTLLDRNDEIRIIIETDTVILHQLPWNLWTFFDDYPQAELGLSNHEYASPQVLKSEKSSTGKVRILAILGNRVGIDIDRDSSLLQSLSDTQTTFIVEPSRKELDRQLWNYDWDILFFAGHSASFADGERGEIYINQTESLTIYQLKNALKTAIKRGLKIAIFNSCDGIGLARNFADLNIPQMIVMRMGVPDLIAQEFLKHFLTAFANTRPLYLAVREARERLQGLENEFPCASWLPVIYQNPTTIPTTWNELRDDDFRETKSITKSDTKYIAQALPESKNLLPKSDSNADSKSGSKSNSKSNSKSKLFTLLISIFVVAFSTIGLRYLGVFEKIELQSFDQMLRLRPREHPDPRVVVVEVTEKDIQSLQEKTRGLKSISDQNLAKLLNKIQEYQPRVIGLDIYRDFLDPPDKSDPIQLSNELSEDNLVVICKGLDRQYDPQGVKPPEGVPLERQAFSDAIQDPDGIVRRQILMLRQDPASPCTTPTSLSLQLASGYLSYNNIIPEIRGDGYVKFGSKIFKPLKPGHSGAYQQGFNLEGVDLGGIQILINYRNTNDHFRVSLQDVLNDKVTPDLLKDKVVMIGVTANTVSDTWSTPYSNAKQTYQEIPGVFIQAQKVSQILSAVLEQRPSLWVLPFWGDIIWIFGWSVLGSVIFWRVHSLSGKGYATVAIVVILYGVCAIALFQEGLWLPFIPSAFGIVAVSVSILLIQNR